MVSASAGAVLVRQHMGHLQAREMVKIWPFEIDHMISINTMNAMGGSAELKITKPPGSRMNERATTNKRTGEFAELVDIVSELLSTELLCSLLPFSPAPLSLPPPG